MRALRASDGQLPSARYAGYRWPGTDIENLLFNNIDQTLDLFGRPSSSGLRFRDLGREFSVGPLGIARSSYYT